MGIECPDIFGADEQADRNGDAVGHARFAAVDDDESAEFAGFIVGSYDRRSRGQQRGREEHREAGDCGEPGIPERERQNHETGAGDSEQDAERGPRTLIAAQIQNFGNEQNSGEQRADQHFLQAREGVRRL